MASKTTVSSTTKRKIGKSSKHVPIIDSSQAGSNIQVLRLCLQELGWKECIISSSTEPDIYWHGGSFHDNNKNFNPNSARVNKFPDGSEGEGIFLIQDPTRCTTVNRPYIVQEYVDRPLLMNGLKFDMRIYVLILKLNPLEVLLYQEGLARFATVEYQAPSKKNLHESFMHLTNYSLNKRSANYKHASDETQTDASKRKLSVVWSQLGQLFSPSEIEQTKEMIEDMINKTVLAILPELHVQYALELPMTCKQNPCFQVSTTIF
ncbi:unnamed protein product [Rotaria sp. Silwood1]|nr:unnamed protein product [Rotaria sp. Silwood1]CAF5008593.1 unnamed protein product [Rotaria sp. Silwood1]CAF5013747.1 unnamed protein product [Rotaria sp. Silwood1]